MILPNLRHPVPSLTNFKHLMNRLRPVSPTYYLEDIAELNLNCQALNLMRLYFPDRMEADLYTAPWDEVMRNFLSQVEDQYFPVDWYALDQMYQTYMSTLEAGDLELFGLQTMLIPYATSNWSMGAIDDDLNRLLVSALTRYDADTAEMTMTDTTLADAVWENLYHWVDGGDTYAQAILGLLGAGDEQDLPAIRFNAHHGDFSHLPRPLCWLNDVAAVLNADNDNPFLDVRSDYLWYDVWDSDFQSFEWLKPSAVPFLRQKWNEAEETAQHFTLFTDWLQGHNEDEFKGEWAKYQRVWTTTASELAGGGRLNPSAKQRTLYVVEALTAGITHEQRSFA